MFQSPSLRGSGRFRLIGTEARSGSPRFNPLHCGAVVASHRRCCRLRRYRSVSIPFIAGQWSLPGGARRRRGAPGPFQSPSLRGSGRFFSPLPPALRRVGVSIPFIAGQWSLQIEARRDAEERANFNPLHCGAVVASSPEGGRAIQIGSDFNPLHCGAVVASSRPRRKKKSRV